MAKKPSDSSKLSTLGRKVERVIAAQLAAMEKDLAESAKEKRDPKYSLTDFTKVWDRALKLEAIRQRVPDEGEGGFFRQEGADDEPE